MRVLMQLILLLEVHLQLNSIELGDHFKLVINDLFSTAIELRLIKVKRRELIWCLEDEIDFVVENLVPQEDAEIVSHKSVFNVQAIPTLLFAIVL